MDGADDLQRRLAAMADTKLMLGTVATAAVQEAKGLVPRRTGNLARTIRVGRVTEESAEVLAGGRSKIGYARYVEFGTRPHIIRPRRARVLAWGGSRTLGGRLRSGGRATHFARLVHHPGTRAHPYLVPGIKRALARAGITARIVDAWNRAA